MRISSIHIEGFGVLRERTWQTDRPLTLFYGANEAGKSTLMGFIRAVLFGFPSRSNRAERYEPQGGGAHGGALILLDEQGQRIRVERYDAAGTGGRRSSAGIVKVTLADGTPGGEELLSSLLGGLSGELFRSLFAFGLTELQELRTLQSDELSGYLYSAGLGLSGAGIMEAERKLTAQTDGLYRPRGRNQEMNRLLRELEGLEQRLRRSKEQAAEYDRLQEERRIAEARIAGLEQRQEALRAELAMLELAGKARSGWVRLKQIAQELERLPALDGFPEQASARLDALEEELGRCEAERSRLSLKQQSLLEHMNAKQPDPELLDHQTELNHLLEQSFSYEDNKRSLAGLEVSLEQQRLAVERLLAQIDERWTADTLAAFPVSISLREQIRSFQGRFSSFHDEEQRLRTERESLRLQIVRTKDTIDAMEQETSASARMFEAAGTVRWSADSSSALQHLAREYARWQLLERDIAHAQDRDAERQRHQEALAEAALQSRASAKLRQQRLSLLTALLAAVLAGWLGWQGNTGAAILAFALLAGLSVILYATGSPRSVASSKRGSRPRPQPTPDYSDSSASIELRRLKEQKAKLEQSLHELLNRLYGAQREAAATRGNDVASTDSSSEYTAGSPFRRGGSFSLSDLEPLLDRWQQEAEQWKQRFHHEQRKRDKLEDALDALQALQQRDKQLQEAQFQLDTRVRGLKDEWSGWLEQHRLHAQLSVEAALETIQTVEQGHEQLRQLSKLEAQFMMLKESISRFEQSIAALLGEHTRLEPVLALKRWKEQEQEQLRFLEEQRLHREQRDEIAQELLVQEERYRRLLERIGLLLQEAYAEHGEQLRFHEQCHMQRGRLQEERAMLEAGLESLVGVSRLPALSELLGAYGEDELLRSMQQLEHKLAETYTEVNELREQMGKLTGAIEQLEHGQDHAELLLQTESCRASIGQLADQYAVASLAALLIKKARDVYEQERQPGVLLRASDYLKTMTGGQLVQVKAPFGEQRLVAIRANGQAVDTGFLSRGTAEQLYLSMRFALAEEYAGKAVLPLVLDDILVNFDDHRMAACLEVLREFSSRHQVLLFTCHRHVRDAAARLIPGHTIIEL